MASTERDGAGPEPGGSTVDVAPGPEPATPAVLAGSPDVIVNSLGEYARVWLRRVRGGESGALPVVLGLVAIVIYFQIRNSLFLSAGNLVNLILQASWIMMLGMAQVFVLLLGEIDLSIGYSSAMGATITCWMLPAVHPMPWWLAVLAGLGAGAATVGAAALSRNGH